MALARSSLLAAVADFLRRNTVMPQKTGDCGMREAFGGESREFAEKSFDVFAAQDEIQKVTILESFLLRAGVDHARSY